MRSVSQPRHSTRAVVVAAILIAFSISGLAVGVFAQGITHAAASRANKPQTQQGAGNTSSSSTHTPTTPASTATATTSTLPAVVPTRPFYLTAAISPKTVAPGQSFTLIATVVDAQNHTLPVANLECYLRTPNGGVPLFQQSPAPQVTDAQGIAEWSLVAPQAAPGQYTLEVVAYGANNIHFAWDPSITITGQ